VCFFFLFFKLKKNILSTQQNFSIFLVVFSRISNLERVNKKSEERNKIEKYAKRNENVNLIEKKNKKEKMKFLVTRQAFHA